ncbi:hypothetical protein [Rossellomorea vietnamensis]|uniref:hypothetical protein n=1 Tax=Rossellomorea vietnamensis TaxID=218284 RepID=UPI0016539D89|nr:hypothetical protein [Rossellomorea vietnamensis]
MRKQPFAKFAAVLKSSSEKASKNTILYGKMKAVNPLHGPVSLDPKPAGCYAEW